MRRGCWLILIGLQLAYAQDRWPQFELPVIPGSISRKVISALSSLLRKTEDPNASEVRLSRIRDGYLALNKNADAAQAAELVVGEALTAKGYPQEQVMAMQELLGILVKAGVVELQTDKLPSAALEAQSDKSGTSTGDTKAARGPSQNTYVSQAIPRRLAQAERTSILRTMRAVGVALRRAAAARSFMLFLKADVGSYQQWTAMSEEEQEETRVELAQQLLRTCKEYGLTGEQLQKYAPLAGIQVPDLTKASAREIDDLSAEMAANHALQKMAWSMGRDLSMEAVAAFRERTDDVLLRRIGIEPTPELDQAFGNFSAEARRFVSLSREALQANNVMDGEMQSSFLNATATADRIVSTLETINVTDVLISATQLMMDAEPYLNKSIESPATQSLQPWQLLLRLSKIQKAASLQRATFTYPLPEDNELQGLLLLNQSGAAQNDPLFRALNLTAIEAITADGAVDADELRQLVERIGTLNELYTVDDFARLANEVEDNYRALHGMFPAHAQPAGEITGSPREAGRAAKNSEWTEVEADSTGDLT